MVSRVTCVAGCRRLAAPRRRVAEHVRALLSCARAPPPVTAPRRRGLAACRCAPLLLCRRCLLTRVPGKPAAPKPTESPGSAPGQAPAPGAPTPPEWTPGPSEAPGGAGEKKEKKQETKG